MNCPRCEHHASKVLESRVPEAADTIRRRRQCLECEYRFTTYERVEQVLPWVVKHDGSVEPFDRGKVLAGLARACSKRGVPSERLEVLVIEIETRLRDSCAKQVNSSDIGALVLEGLFGIDDVAYVRFASVYRQFDGIDEFRHELERVARRRLERTHTGMDRKPAPEVRKTAAIS